MDGEWYRRYLDMMNQWLILNQEGKNIATHIKKRGWSTIAVYGMAIYGRHVIRTLKGTECSILYGIDRRVQGAYNGVKILKPTDFLPEVDVIINSVIHDHMTIERDLKNRVSCPIVSLEEIIFLSY